MVNEQNLIISSIECFSPIGKSDHKTVMFTLYTGVDDTNDQEVEFVYELNKGKYELMRNSVAELDWNRALSNSSVDQCWDMIKSVILNKMEEYIPKVRKKKNSKKSPIWMNGVLRKKVKQKYALYKTYFITKMHEITTSI